VPNLVQQFKSLLPDSTLLVGDVASISSNILTIDLPDGSQITARGVATVGQSVFARGGMVEGLAPTLGYVEVDI